MQIPRPFFLYIPVFPKENWYTVLDSVLKNNNYTNKRLPFNLKSV